MSKQDGLAYEMCYGIISTSNYKDPWWCPKEQHYW
jgi:hypothetical protein